MASPLEMMENLSFDTKMVSTTLAEDYLSKHENLLSQIKNDKNNPNVKEMTVNPTELPFIMKEIAKKVTENAKLFAQLEYIERKIEVGSVIAYDIPLLVNRLKGYSPTTYHPHDGNVICIQIEDGQPLSTLGFIIDHFKKGHKYYVIPSDKTVAICHLFVSICKECGLDGVEISMALQSNSSVMKLPFIVSSSHINIQPYSDVTLGTMAVLTEKCDIDSAISSLIYATTNPLYPWRLRRILVQEPIYEKFIAALSYKTNQKDSDSCMKTLTFKQNTFLIDYFGDDDNRGVIIEAYRTTKELSSLMFKYQPSYLSLWASDHSVINEIAYSTTANVVWVNEYGVFDRKVVGEHFYSGRDFAFSLHEKNNTEQYDATTKIIKKLMNLKIKWQKYDLDARKCVLLHRVKGYSGLEGDGLSDIVGFIQNFNIDSLVDVRDGISCLAYKSAFKGLVVLSELNLKVTLEALLIGNAVVNKGDEWLIDDNIPYLNTNKGDDYDSLWRQENVSFKYNPKLDNYSTGQWKVLLSYFGETFAN